MKRTLVIAAAALLAGCGTPMHAEMLGESIKFFAGKLKSNNEKVWITGPADNACNAGCQTSCGGGADKSSVPSVGGLFGGGSKDGSSSYDRLAFEVFANYFTQNHRMRVVETHRHNYATETGAQTRQKIDTITNEGKTTVSGMSCEDLCILDEAKKRKSDKVLVYHVMEMSADEMKIHLRLSDVPTGVVEASETIKVIGLRAFDFSPPNLARQRRTEAAPTQTE
jgi:hypothetical protein